MASLDCIRRPFAMHRPVPDDAASQRRRFGYRRPGLLLARQGFRINQEKLYRLYKEERPSVLKRGSRKRALGTRAPMAIPRDQNLRWSPDFVMDTLVSGRRFRTLAAIDDFTRECLGLVVDTSLTALRVMRELDYLIEARDCPRMIVSDSGTEFTSNAILGLAAKAWDSTTSRPASRCRTASSKASTVVCATSAQRALVR